MDFCIALSWASIALLFGVVFALVFSVLYLIFAVAPISGPGWLFWPIIAFMLSASSYAAYELVIDPALDDDETECSERSSIDLCPTPALT